MTVIDWQTYFLNLAKAVSLRGSCPTRQVGAVIVDTRTNALISSGYNGAPRGTPHCGEECANRQMGSNTKVCRAVHAELNAILNSAFTGAKTEGGTIYITISPCLSCARAIIQAGIVQVIAAGKSPYDRALDLLKEAGIGVKIITGTTYRAVRISPV